MVMSLGGIARILGAEGFKKYAHDYGNERVNINGSVDDAVYILDSYRDGDDLIDHFNEFRDNIFNEYNSKGYVPFYKTKAFVSQGNELRANGLFASDFY